MIAVRKPSGSLARPAPRRREADEAVSRHHGVLARFTALFLVVSIFTTLAGSGHPADFASPFLLQAQASALQQRWSEMVAEGVAASDLAPLQQEAATAESRTWFGVPLVFLWPDSKALIERWQAQTDLVWRRSIDAARDDAAGAARRLHALLPQEPAAQLKERLEELAVATTPAQFHALREEWTLQARLVPIDREVAALVGRLNTFVERAKALGIKTDPSAAIVARAAAYAELPDQDRYVGAAMLIRDLQVTATDLNARIEAAGRAKQAFKKVADAMSSAAATGLAVAGYQPRVDANSRAYAAATTVAQLDAVTKDLGQLATTIGHDLAVWMSRVHVIAGVALYYQSHSLSCEEASVSMALTHQGINLSQDQILREMGADLRPKYVDASGRVRWGNPYISFVGSVDGSEKNYTGYQANYPPLVRVARAHGARILAYGYMTAATIYAQVAAGHPVVAWATWDWAWHPRHDYLSFDGRWIPWIGPKYESHVYVVVGVRSDAVLVNDPLRGQYWVGKASFQAAYSDFMEAIVFA